MLDKRFRLYTIIYLIFHIAVMAVLSMGGFEKYLFCIGVGGFIFILMNKKISNSDMLVFALPWLFYIVWGLFLCIAKQNFGSNTLKQVLFYLIPFFMAFIVAIYFKKNMPVFVDTLFWATLIIFFVTGIRSFNRANLMESQYAFTFGLFALYFFFYKKYIQLLPCLVGLYLANKRIALGAVLIGIAFYMFFFLLRKERVRRAWLIIVYLCMVVAVELYIYLIRSGVMERFFARYRINSNGRMNIYGLMAEFYEFGVDYAGAGIGMVRDYVSSFGFSAFQLLHNDLLSMYIEIGFCGFLFFLLLYGYVLLRRSKRWNADAAVFVMGIFVYTFVLFATDNVSIYINYFYPLYVVVFAAINGMERRKNGKKR